jgi:hypothetical protein
VVIRCEVKDLALAIGERVADTARRERLGAAARAAILETAGVAGRYAAGVGSMVPAAR